MHPTRHLLCAVALCALAACVQTPDTTPHGQERVEACIATACDTLNVDGLGLGDYTQLSGLSHVTSLMVSYTDFSDLADISGMGQLRELHLGQTPIRDLSGLAGFTNLRLIHMQGVSAEALASAQFPTGITELAVGGSGLTDLSVVRRVPGLQRLHVDTYGTPTDLSALEGHRNLHTLHLGDVAGMELAPLLSLPALRHVSLALDFRGPDPAQTSVIAQLRARGVTVSTEEIVVPVC